MEKINFLATDNAELTGLLYKSTKKTDKIIIAVHGMTSNCFKKRDEVIAKKANKNEIDYFCFNNRGSDITRYIRKNHKKFLGGMAFEDVLECHHDIIGAINKMKELGYTEIYLQGHSLGSTKVVYTYNKLLKDNNLEILANIKSLILLSLVDIPTVLQFYLKDKSKNYIKMAQEKIENGEEISFMPKDSFIHPISPRTFLQYTTNYEEFDFINTIKDENLEILNNINIPLFMRWGNVQELILQDADQYVPKIRSIIKNENADINFIYGADHGYHNKEEILANEIMEFIRKL